MKVRLEIVGNSPLLMHNPRMVDPDYEIAREIKKLSGKRKKTDEDLRQIGKLEWYGGLYENNGEIVQHTSKLRKCIINTAKTRKLGKAVERTLSFIDLFVPLVYEGPKDINKLFADEQFHSRLSVGIGGKRVMRVRPKFFPWQFECDGIFVEDIGLNFDELQQIVELAGLIEGIGDNRVNGYGRFTGKVVQI